MEHGGENLRRDSRSEPRSDECGLPDVAVDLIDKYGEESARCNPLASWTMLKDIKFNGHMAAWPTFFIYREAPISIFMGLI